MDQPDKVEPIPQPAPKPPRATRPLKLSVTAIEDWLRDPYTIYAKHILKLDPLDPVDMPLSAADRGSAIHDALGEFTQTYAAGAAAPIRRGVLREIGEKHFAPLMERPEARALWWPRFQRIARWFAEWESGAARRNRRASTPRSGARSRSRSTTNGHSPVGARRPHRAPRRRHATPSSTTRPGSRRPASRCGWGCRRS